VSQLRQERCHMRRRVDLELLHRDI
jgi:hypothetical protein